MIETAKGLNIKAPSENEIEAILSELDDNNDGTLEQDEFQNLIIMIFKNMLDNERDIIAKIKKK